MAQVRNNVEQQGVLPLDCPLRGEIRGERSIMDFPFFALEKKTLPDEIEHSVGRTSIKIRAGGAGRATMYDKETLRYGASLICERMRRGEEVTQEIVFTAHDFFRATGTRNPGKRNYDRFNEALSRLQGTQIQTNLKTGGQIHRGWFSWVENAQAVYDDGSTTGIERLRAVKLRLCDFLFRAIQRDQQIYSYHHDYFRLGLIERRIYEIARSHCDEGPYAVPLDELYAAVGTRTAIRKFKAQLMEMEEQNALPQYTVTVRENTEGTSKRAKASETIVTLAERPRELVTILPSVYEAIAA